MILDGWTVELDEDETGYYYNVVVLDSDGRMVTGNSYDSLTEASAYAQAFADLGADLQDET